MEKYNLPFRQRSSLKWYMNILILFSTLGTIVGAYFFLFIVTKDDLLEGIVFGLFFLTLSICFGYMYVTVQVLKKFFIKITPKYIEISQMFRTRLAYWKDIESVHFYEVNNNLMLGFLLKKDKKKAQKRTIDNAFRSMSGIPRLSFQVSLTLFKDIDLEKLCNTIEEQIVKNYVEDEVHTEYDSYDEEYEESLSKAVLYSSLIYIIISALYGFTIYKFEMNFVVISIFGSLLISSVFNKYYIEKSFNLVVRMFIGVICLMQLPTAIIIASTLSINIPITRDLIWYVMVDHFRYLLDEPLEHIIVIIVGIICFGMGFFKGRTSIYKTEE